MNNFIKLAWCGCLLVEGFDTVSAGTSCDHTGVESDLSSLMQVTTDIKSGKTHARPGMDKGKTQASDGKHGHTTQEAATSLLQSLRTRLGVEGVGDSLLAVFVMFLVVGPLLVATLFSMFLMDAPKYKKGADHRGCPCCPWPLSGEAKERWEALRSGEKEGDEAPKLLRHVPKFTDPVDTQTGAETQAPTTGAADPGTVTTTTAGGVSMSPWGAGDASVGGFWIHPSRHQEVAVPEVQRPAAAPIGHYHRPGLLNDTMLVTQPEGLTLHIFGQQILPIEQQSSLKAFMNYGDTGSRLIMNIFIAEQAEDKGIMLQSAQSFPLAFVDTRMAVKWSAAPPRVKRHVKIFSDIQSQTISPESPPPFYVHVEPTNTQGHFAVMPVQDGKKGKVWYNVRFTDDSCNVVDDYGRLIAGMEIRRKGDTGIMGGAKEGNAIYVMEITQDTDASLIMAMLLGVFKLQ